MKLAVEQTQRNRLSRFLPEWLLSRAGQADPETIPDEIRLPQRRRVVLVDDDAIVRSVTSHVLRKAGHEVVTAADASEAIGAVAAIKPDVILLDLNFPPEITWGGSVNWDGLRLMFWLRNLKNARGARFIVITGNDSPVSRKQALAAGVDGYFQKPIPHEELLELIEREPDATARLNFEI